MSRSRAAPATGDGDTATPAPQLAPWVRRPRGLAGWLVLVACVVLGAVIAFPIGLGLVALANFAWFIRGVIWLLVTVWVWLWFALSRLRRREYPFILRPPTDARARSTVFNDAFLRTFPRLIGLTARVAVFLFAPIVLLSGLAGIVILPRLAHKLTGLGRNRGFFNDGESTDIVAYDDYLRETFPERADFLRWWRNPHAIAEFAPDAPRWQHPGHFSGLALGPYPDALGYPGLAAAAMRRRAITGLRELFISQREIDDMGDPDLDDRADCAVIRIVGRQDHGVHWWIIQLPSTQSWHPRAGLAPNDLTADIVALSHDETALTRAALAAMHLAGIRTGDRVLAAGFSLGGLVAGQIVARCAHTGFTVTHLVTAGAPIGRYRIDPAVRVLAMEHLLDSVPRIDGRENPIRNGDESGAGQWITVRAGPPLPRGYRISSTHHSPSYAETAGAIEERPPNDLVRRYLDGKDAGDDEHGGTGDDESTGIDDGILKFFGSGQRIQDFAVTRSNVAEPRPAVPIYLYSTVEGGITRGTLRTTLRRVPGVIAVDIYQSRTGFPTTIMWNADVLVRSLTPWFQDVERRIVYRGLLSLLKRRRAVGIRLRLQAKESSGVLWDATVQRMEDGRWREWVDVSFPTPEAEREFLPVLLPGGWASRINYYPADAFDVEPTGDTTA